MRRRLWITYQVNGFHQYLTSIGFDPPKDFPPLEIVPGKRGLSRERQYPGTIYDEKIRVGERSIDKSDNVRRVFADYIFDRLFGIVVATDKRAEFEENAAAVFSAYYLSSYANQPPTGSNKWECALWEIHEKHGQAFTDRALFFALKQWDQPFDNIEKEDFDHFFAIRLRNGVYVEDNFQQNAGNISSILKSHGLPTQ
jgi:hypothetical protein